MRKRVLSLLLVMAVSLAACGGKESGEDKQADSGKDEEMEITIYTFAGAMADDMQAAVDWLEGEMPNVHVTLTSDQGPNLRKSMQVNAASGTMPDMWGMFGGTIGDYYTKNGLVYDLSDYAEEHNWDDLYLSSVLDLCRLDGILAGYPSSYTSLEIIYRKDTFADAGIKEVPKTMEEFEDCLAKIKATGVTPFAVGGATQANPMRIFQALLENYAGAEEHDALMNMETSWECESVVAALGKFKEWVDLGYFPDGYLSINQTDNMMMIGSGTSAMMVDGPYTATYLAANGYDIENFGFFKFPQDKGGRISSYVQMYMISKDVSEEKLEVLMKLLDYCYGEENVANRGVEHTYPLCYKDAKMPEGFEIADAVAEDVEEYGTYLISDQVLPQSVVSTLYAAMDYIGSGDMTPEETAAYMQKCIDDYKAGEQN